MLQFWQIHILYVKHLWHIRVTTLLLGNFEAPRTIGSTAVSDQSYSLWSSHGTLAQPQDYSFFQLLPVCLNAFFSWLQISLFFFIECPRCIFNAIHDQRMAEKLYIVKCEKLYQVWIAMFSPSLTLADPKSWYQGWLRCSWQGVQFNIWRATFMDHIHFGLQLFIVTVVTYFGSRFVIAIGAKPL